jgi:hypothetical protein
MWDDEDDAEAALKNEVGLKKCPDCSVVDLDEDEEEDKPDPGPSIAHRLISLLFYVMGGLGIIIFWWVAEGCKPISVRIDVPGLHFYVEDVPQLRQEIQELKNRIER